VWKHVSIRRLAASALQELLEVEGFNVKTIDAGKIPEGTFIANLVDATETPDDVLFITDLGRTGEDGMNALNYQREVFVEHPLLTVFWVRESELNTVASLAPDFWVFRHRVVEFTEMADEPSVGIPMSRILGDTTYGSLEELRTKLALRNSLLEELPDDANSARVRLLTETGNMYQSIGEIAAAVERHQQALAISREIGDRQGEGNALGNLGNAYFSFGEVEKAIDHHSQALVISREIGDRRGESADLGNLGLAYGDLGEVEKAIDHHSQALIISREIGDRLAERGHLCNLGNAYFGLGEVEKAVDHHNQALVISKKICDRRGVANAIGNLGLAYDGLGEVEKAIDYYNQSLVISRAIGDRQGEGADLGNLGLAYDGLGEVEKAIDHYNQSLVISREIGDRQGEGAGLGNLGIRYLERDEYEDALRYLLSSFVTFQTIKHPNAEIVSTNIAVLRKKLGEAQFKTMQKKVAGELGIAIPDWD
jgi:tetratricopeptide (TPR) repeat protein